MKEIKAYKTKDGKVFEVKEDAQFHDRKLEFIEWYDSGSDVQLFTEYDKVEAVKILDWLVVNEEKISNLFSGENKNE